MGHLSFVDWGRQNLKKSEREENSETKVEEKQASPLVSRTPTCFLYLAQCISYSANIHESHAEYYYLARSSLSHLLSLLTDWEAHGRYWRPSEHPWGFSSSSQVLLPAAMTAICVFVQMIQFWFPQKSLFKSQWKLRQSVAAILTIFSVWGFSPKWSCKISFFYHLHAQAETHPRITIKLGSLSNPNQRTN